MTSREQAPLELEEKIRAGLLDDILAQIDAEYANYHQTPVFLCQEEELAYWSRYTPANGNEMPSKSTAETLSSNSIIENPGQ